MLSGVLFREEFVLRHLLILIHFILITSLSENWRFLNLLVVSKLYAANWLILRLQIQIIRQLLFLRAHEVVLKIHFELIRILHLILLNLRFTLRHLDIGKFIDWIVASYGIILMKLGVVILINLVGKGALVPWLLLRLCYPSF